MLLLLSYSLSAASIDGNSDPLPARGGGLGPQDANNLSNETNDLLREILREMKLSRADASNNHREVVGALATAFKVDGK